MELGQKQFFQGWVAILVASALPTGRWVPTPEMRLDTRCAYYARKPEEHLMLAVGK